MQHHAADQLDIEVAHLEYAAAGFADHGKRFNQNLVQGFVDGLGALVVDLLKPIRVCVRLLGNACQTGLDALPELVSLGTQLVIRDLLHLRFKRIDGLDPRHQMLQFALVLGPENLA